jgi:hypothetical protein
VLVGVADEDIVVIGQRSYCRGWSRASVRGLLGNSLKELLQQTLTVAAAIKLSRRLRVQVSIMSFLSVSAS